MKLKLDYRSPIEDHPALQCTETDEGSLWTYQGVGALMPSRPAVMAPHIQSWYAARRDANLMGVCPLCGAKMPPVRTATAQTGRMVHENDCPVTDRTWVRAFQRSIQQ